MIEMNKLYPQYSFVNDRRKQNIPVTQERRSGLDRRSGTRINLDTNLTKDIYEVKNKVALNQSQGIKTENKAQKISFTQNASKAIQHTLSKDIFTKATKDYDVARETANIEVNKKYASDTMLAGVLGTIFVGTLAAVSLGGAGIAVALGLGTFVGCKAISEAIKSHI